MMRVQKSLSRLGALLALAALAGCGGSGGSRASSTPVGKEMGGAIQGVSLALSGSVSTFAGSSSSTDGTGASARFNLPSDVVSDGTNLYVADTGNSTIRKISIATGATSTLAGSAGITGSADGTGSAARFNYPYGITVSPDKTTLFVCDTGNDTIRAVSISSGAVTTLAGAAGVIGSADGAGAAARFNAPAGITTDGTYLYLADTVNNAIRKVTISTAEVSTLAGGVDGFADGSGVQARFDRPYGIATDGTNLYLTDNGNGAIRRIDLGSGAVSTLVQPESGFLAPAGIATDGSNLFVSDESGNVVKKVVIATQAVSTIAGDAVNGAPGSTDGIGGAARFDSPAGIAIDGSNLYLADAGNGTIRRIAIASGAVSTLSGTPASADGAGAGAAFNFPCDVTTDGKNLYVADTGSNTIRKIAIATGMVSTVAGSAGVSGSDDGIGAAARFNSPTGITTDGSSLFVADTGNNTVRRIDIASGAVSTLAGSAGVAGSADGSGSAATFNSPAGITTDGKELYLTDSGNASIRRIRIASSEVTTLASGAGFQSPYGITTDGTTLYLADAGNRRIAKIDIATGAVSTLQVSGASFQFPTAVSSDGSSLFVTDPGSGAIFRIGLATGTATTLSSGLRDPSGVTTDGKSVYLTDAESNVLLRIR